MSRLLTITAIAFGALVLASSASAGTKIIAPADATMNFQSIVDRSKMPTPDITIVVTQDDIRGVCLRGVAGCATVIDGVPVIALARFASRYDFRHELGHHFDRVLLTADLRARFTWLFGQPAGTDWQLIDEPFADLFDICSTQRPIDWEFLSFRPFGYDEPSIFYLKRRRVMRGCGLIQRAAGVGVPSRVEVESERQS